MEETTTDLLPLHWGCGGTVLDMPVVADRRSFTEEPEPIVLTEDPAPDIRFCADGVIRLQLPPGIHISEAVARKTIDRLIELSGGRTVPVLLQLTGVGSVSRRARRAYAATKSASAFALLGESPVDRVIASFFLGGEAPNCPTKFFTSESEALTWLEGYVQAEEVS
ncbi:DUF7793 family protein [Arthrobacter sp. H14]|uniref:DUF7793 family protein n=1 Tax=Arthrobacter sp. H14 TaxID=1312959 RepID=UPI0012DF39EE|nr:STAS/SEC14 domain-containing protein [Arthrobacter sp. H14]